jgi:hypothetical protein
MWQQYLCVHYIWCILYSPKCGNNTSVCIIFGAYDILLNAVTILVCASVIFREHYILISAVKTFVSTTYLGRIKFGKAL